MSQTIKVAPPNSILFVSGPKDFEIPEIPRSGDVSIWSTPTCIIFGCRMFADGETEVTLCAADEVETDLPLRFDAMLETPHGALVVWTVEDEIVLRGEAPHGQTRVRIWSDHPLEPDHVIIGLG